MATKTIDASDGDALEISWPDGSVLRLRWDGAESAVKLTAETCRGLLARELVVLPRSSNGILLRVI